MELKISADLLTIRILTIRCKFFTELAPRPIQS